MKKFSLAAFAVACALSSGAQAVTIDGTFSAGEYAGALVTTVQYQQGTDPGTQYPNTPGTYVENVGYTVYYTSDANNIYVGLQSDSPSGLNFANLYFDTNNTSPGGAGSDIGFEVLNNRIFVPATGVFSTSSLTDLGGAFATTPASGTTGNIIEVSIPWTVFMTNATGLGQPLVGPGGLLQLRTSQSFNYASVTGDGTAGDVIARFGSVAAPLAAVPEPASWAMMIAGFGLVGGSLRRRTTGAARFA